mgnify:CR=1 FL=1
MFDLLKFVFNKNIKNITIKPSQLTTIDLNSGVFLGYDFASGDSCSKFDNCFKMSKTSCTNIPNSGLCSEENSKTLLMSCNTNSARIGLSCISQSFFPKISLLRKVTKKSFPNRLESRVKSTDFPTVLKRKQK